MLVPVLNVQVSFGDLQLAFHHYHRPMVVADVAVGIKNDIADQQCQVLLRGGRPPIEEAKYTMIDREPV